MAAGPQRPHHTGNIAGPPGHVTRTGVQRNLQPAVSAVAAHGDRLAAIRRERDHGALRQRDWQCPAEVVVGVLANQVDPPRRGVSDGLGHHPPSSRRRSATLSGVTSLINASIADSEPARYFSATALRRIDISSTWK